jgi:hypothetical protein
MQERARRRELDVIRAAPRHNRFETIEHSRLVGAPDVAAVDDAKRQDEALRRLGGDLVKLLRRPDKVEVEAGNRQRQRASISVTGSDPGKAGPRQRPASQETC